MQPFAGELRLYLDQGYGECYLRQPRIARLVQKSFLFFDRERYRLSARVIMPNHVHLPLTPGEGQKLSRILQSLESYTANLANKLASRSGLFWQPESFDRYVRDVNHFAKVIAYIESNPVKAHLCEKAEDWKFSSAWFRKRGGR